MGFWSSLKRGLGLGHPSSRRLEKRRRSPPSIIGSTVGSGSIAASDSIAPSGSIAASSIASSRTSSFFPSVPTIPEEIEIIEEDDLPSPQIKPKKIGFWRRFSRKKKQPPAATSPPKSQMSYTLPSTSDLMHGVAPIAPSVTDSALRNQVREAMGNGPRRPHSDAPSVRSEASQVPSFTRTPVRMQASPTQSPLRRGSDYYRTSPKPPSPPLPRQTPRLKTIDVPSIKVTPPKLARSVSGGTGTTRKISVREITEDGTDADAQSVAAMSYLSRKSKSARIFEVAEVISGGTLSPVSEEASITAEKTVKGTGSLAAIESWAMGHSTRLDMIEEKLQVLKAEILQNKPTKRRYFTA